MGREIEGKFAVADLSAVAAALAKAGAVFLGAALETDTFFDTPGEEFRHGDKCLRLRRIDVLEAGAENAGEGCLLTFKGPQDAQAVFKSRQEIQTALGDAEAATGILQALGFERKLVIQKRRRSYAMGGCRIELDELPLIGCFVEIEGPDEAAIERLRAGLGVAGPSVREPYTRLLAQRCRELNLPGDRITF